ncbi:MAG: protein-methionine-sulfoxide reductase catalytic subunit MsrP, partial [Acetobacteraceae bacterium]|nr:protein-methionine-sulfoxide reductase catalytic subunit MsrP [Acetobacteraceae bacterium]
MHIIRRREWEIRESQVTPERFVLGRRAALAGAAALVLPRGAMAQGAPRNPAYANADRAMTAEQDATTYNNFYEFGTEKSIWRAAQRMPVSPWQIKIEGMVERPRTIDLDDLLKQVRLEERVYRHRCVEAWAMTVPWTGFAMRDLIRLCAPTSAARYVEMETLADPRSMPGLRLPIIDWPYQEGLTLAEANNELAFIATGLYGKSLPK